MDKGKLIEILRNDNDIRNEILNLVKKEINLYEDKVVEAHNPEYEKLKEKYKNLDEQYEKICEKKEELKGELKSAKDEYNYLKQEYDSLDEKYRNLSDEKQTVLNEKNNLEQKVQGIMTTYDLYVNLGEEVHERLERVLNPGKKMCDDVTLFLGFGFQEGNITALWELIVANLDFYEERGKLNDMITIFNYFLEKYEKITYKPIEINTPHVGDIFNERYHIRTSNSCATGRITKVILTGFTIGKNINKKALVVVN